MPSRYFMAAQEEDTLEVIIYGDLTSFCWRGSDMSSYNLARILRESEAEKITVRINSYGGEDAEGLAIHNELRTKSEAGVEVTTVDMGFACSAAAVVFCAGDKRIMNQASLLMVHNPWMYAAGNADDLRKAADDLDTMGDAAANAFRRVMQITEDELEELLENESWIAPEDAVSYGFATEISGQEAAEKAAASARPLVMDKMLSANQCAAVNEQRIAENVIELLKKDMEAGNPPEELTIMDHFKKFIK